MEVSISKDLGGVESKSSSRLIPELSAAKARIFWFILELYVRNFKSAVESSSVCSIKESFTSFLEKKEIRKEK